MAMQAGLHTAPVAAAPPARPSSFPPPRRKDRAGLRPWGHSRWPSVARLRTPELAGGLLSLSATFTHGLLRSDDAPSEISPHRLGVPSRCAPMCHGLSAAPSPLPASLSLVPLAFKEHCTVMPRPLLSSQDWGSPTPRHSALQHVLPAPNRPRQAAASWHTAAWSLCFPCRPRTPSSCWCGPLRPVCSPNASSTVPLLRGGLPHDLTQPSSPQPQSPLQPLLHPTWKALIRGLLPALDTPPRESPLVVASVSSGSLLTVTLSEVDPRPPFPAGTQDPFLGFPAPPWMQTCSLPRLAVESSSSVVPCPPMLHSLWATLLMRSCHCHFPAERPSPAESPKPHSSFRLGLSEF